MERGRWSGAGALVVLGLVACKAPEPGRKPDPEPPVAAAADAGPAVGPGESVRTEDANQDGRPDVRLTLRKVKGPAGADVERVVRRELDINYDGTFDVTKDYDLSRPAEEGEVLAREVVDSNLDGKPDTTSEMSTPTPWTRVIVSR